MKSILLFFIFSLTTLILSGCSGLGKATHIAGSFIPGSWGQGVKTAAYGIHWMEQQAERKRKEQEQQRRIEEYNRKLAEMSPEERTVFLNKAEERAQLTQQAVTIVGLCMLFGCGGDSSQTSNAQNNEGLIRGAENASRPRTNLPPAQPMYKGRNSLGW